MMTKRNYSVAVDGPGGAGKSSMAKRLAKQLGFVYVDTGAIYRTLGYYVAQQGIDPVDLEQVAASLGNSKLEITYDEDHVQHMLLDGEDVSEKIRTPEMSAMASKISAQPAVRAFLLDMQRKLARTHSVIMDGRDIGTVVLPGADVKIYLTASAEVRATRRYKELLEKGQTVSYEDVLADLKERDHRDMTRAIAPLKQAEDAVLLDSSELSFEETVNAMEKIIRDRAAL